MIKKKKICKTCLTEQFIWKNGSCKSCSSKITPSKPIKKSYLSKEPTAKQVIKKQEKKEYIEKQFELFKEIYREHPTKRCYECNKWVNGESSTQFHHILLKSSSPRFALDKWNIILVCENCHTQIHIDSSKVPKLAKLIEEVKEFVKQKYG